MKVKQKIVAFGLALFVTTNTYASKTGVPELIQSFVTTDLKPILAIMLFVGLLISILYNINKLSMPDGWRPFTTGILTYVVIAIAVAGLIRGFQAMLGTF